MGRKHFTIPCTISHDGYGIDLHALADTRANGFAFINTACAIDTAKFLNIKKTQLEEPIAVKGFDGKQGHSVTYILTLHLSIDGHRQSNIPFCILDLGNYNIILRLKWMDYFNVWLDLRKRTLVWPNDGSRSLSLSFQKEVHTQRQAIAPKKVNRAH
jgi:Retroviral aspartyl protease